MQDSRIRQKEELEEWLLRLRDRDVLIIVEGKKDRAALNRLGLANIITLEGPQYKNVERIAELAASAKRAVILTDLDPEGKKLYSRLKKDLGEHGIEIDDRFREFLFRKTKLRQIEGLDTYIQNLG